MSNLKDKPMISRILDGKILSAEIRAEIKTEVAAYKQQTGAAPGLATILVGDNPASHTYVANKIKACHDVGIESFHEPMLESTSIEELKKKIVQLNENPRVHGILLQLPLPGNADSTPVLDLMDPGKD